MKDLLHLTRRDLLQISVASMAGTVWLDRLYAQQPDSVTKGLIPLNRFPRMMQEYLGEKVAEAARTSIARLAALKTREEAEEHVKQTRGRIADCFGPFPERTPLNPRVTRVIDRETYKIENVIFESRPGFFVSANLYIPKSRKLPMPGVVGSCGHSANGKAAEAYQSFAQGLARQGYVVLIFDPIGQGERFQNLDDNDKSKVGAGVLEHLLCGNQQFLYGDFLGSWHAWDTIRALDYLLTRDEVDPKHVGITGNSGGGTMTMWLCGVESRWTMAASSCAVTTFRRNFDNELPTDTEQMPPLALKHGLDHGDFLSAMAPKPVMIIAAEKDFFDVRGSIETYQRLKPLWRLLGAEQNLQLFIGPNEHGYTQPNREAMYGFFNGQTNIAQGKTEPTITIEKDDTLLCTPKGQVAHIGSLTVQSFTSVAVKSLAAERGELDAAIVQKRVASLIPPLPATPPDSQILRTLSNRSYPRKSFVTYAIETEPYVRAILSRIENTSPLSRPAQREGKVVLYVSHQSSDVELREEQLIKDLLADEPNVEFYALDVRGCGDSQPNTAGTNMFLQPYGSDYFYAVHSLMLGHSLPAQKAFDILRVIDWLKSYGRTEVHLVARGWGTIPATLAAVVSNDVSQVTLKNALTSWTSVAETEHYTWPLSSFVHSVLKSFDLPDCYRALQTKKLKSIEPWSPTQSLAERR